MHSCFVSAWLHQKLAGHPFSFYSASGVVGDKVISIKELDGLGAFAVWPKLGSTPVRTYDG